MAYQPKKKTNIYYKKDGTYYYDKTIKGNRFCAFGFKSQKEAEEALRLDLNLMKNKTFNLKMVDVIKLYKEHLDTIVCFNSVYNKMCFVRKYIEPFFKNYELTEVNYFVLDLWKKHIMEKGKKYSDEHTNKIIHICKQLFEFAENRFNVNTGYRNLTNIKTKTKKKQFEIWSLEQFNQFLTAVDDFKFLVLFHLMFYYGLRLGETIGLKFENINFKKEKISIVSQVVNNSFEHKAMDTDPKTANSIRSFYIDSFTCDLLSKLYVPDKVYVFGEGEKPIGRTTIRKHFNDYIQKSGVPKIVLHSLRRSCSTRLYNTIGDIKAVGTLLGHNEEVMTMHYIQAKKENSLKMIQEMENSIKKDNKIYINLHSKN